MFKGCTYTAAGSQKDGLTKQTLTLKPMKKEEKTAKQQNERLALS